MPETPAALERLSLFTRIPRAGKSKTRLIPGVGAETAAALHHAMTLRALSVARVACSGHPRRELQLSLAGPLEAADTFFARQARVVAQSGGDLGERMQACFRQARSEGIRRHLIIGSDAPALDPERIDQAFAALEQNDLVIGPARDGGYYLIGLSVDPPPTLFQDMPWGSPEVLALSLARAQSQGLSLQLLPALDDVDRPQDLGHWRRLARRYPPLPADSGVSVILPVLNDARRISDCVRRLQAQGAEEIIVVDGGSEDDSREQAARAGAQVLESPPGRAGQMNAGARKATRPILLFLHADTQLAEGWHAALMASMQKADTAGGAFRFRLAARGWRYRLLEWLVALRCRCLRRPYGDQGLFCRSEVFLRLGGYPETPLMEDFLFAGRLRREGRLVMLAPTATSSARNWERAGFWRVVLAHRLVLLGYYLGVPLPRLARLRRQLLRPGR